VADRRSYRRSACHIEGRIFDMTNGSYQTPPEATAVGRVVAVNDKGLKFEGADVWANYSKFAVGIVAPAKGDVVRVTFDRGGFIRAITPTDGSDASPARSVAHNATSARETTITRLAVLKAAAEYAASKPESKSADVLKIAASWERWVLRADDVEG
jgi:hypothetical protein